MPVDVRSWRGSAAGFHARSVPEPAARALWVFDVDRPALVLGSSQPLAHVDADACAAAGVEIVRRRSGGGAVLLRPGEVVWFDVIVPRDVLAAAGVVDDVAASMVWFGRHVADALGRLGVEATVHDGPMVRPPWSGHVCFAGLGPGECSTATGKLVGISQRRTRGAARFQCAVHTRWAPRELVALLARPLPTGELPGVATVPADVAADVSAAVADELA